MADKISIYLSHAPEDRWLARELERHLEILQRQGPITVWSDSKIRPGVERSSEIDRQLSTAQIILLLVSPDFMASDYCYHIMKHALEQHKRGEARFIPVILRPTNWIASPLGMFSPLPRYERPITTWQNRDEAFFEIAEGIRKVVKDLSFSESTLADSPASAVIPFVETSSHSFSQTSYARRIFGKLLLFTGRYEAALRSYEQALRIQPGNPYLYLGKGRALLGLKRNNEALTAYQGAIRLSPDLSAAYEGQGKAYEQLAQQTYEELQEQARTCHEKAKQLGVE